MNVSVGISLRKSSQLAKSFCWLMVEFDVMFNGVFFYLLFAAVDLPFLLIRQSKHGLPVLIRQVQLILQQQGRLFYRHSKIIHLIKNKSTNKQNSHAPF